MSIENYIATQKVVAAASQPPRAARRRLTWLDYILLLSLTLLCAFVAFRINKSLDYRWNWSVVLDFIVHVDPKTGDWRANLLLIGLMMTLRIVFWSGLLALLFGVALGMCRVSVVPILALFARAYVDLIRGIPPLVIIFVFYFFVTSQIIPLIGLDQSLRTAGPHTLSFIEILFGPSRLVPAFIAAAMSLALFEAAYVAEIVRAGVQSIERGQWEASRSLGLSRFSTMRDVILPQALQRMLPPLAGQFISLIKDSSIASLISVQELAFMAAQVSASTFRIFEVWITVAATYFVICFGLTNYLGYLEKTLQKRIR